jgi:hypothetical protein
MSPPMSQGAALPFFRKVLREDWMSWVPCMALLLCDLALKVSMGRFTFQAWGFMRWLLFSPCFPGSIGSPACGQDVVVRRGDGPGGHYGWVEGCCS